MQCGQGLAVPLNCVAAFATLLGQTYVFAEVVQGNQASWLALERAGFTPVVTDDA